LYLGGKRLQIRTEAFANKRLVIVSPGPTNSSGKSLATGDLHVSIANCKTLLSLNLRQTTLANR
jgi:hypothetical protein